MSNPDPISNAPPDLRILALADSKLLPPSVQEPFDHWRIWKARDAVTGTVRNAISRRAVKLGILEMYLERLELADEEKTIFEGIYALAEVVEVYRQQVGIHSQYLVLVMAGQLNPWGLLTFQADYEHPAASVLEAARELWRLAEVHHVDIPVLLKTHEPDPSLAALEVYYASQHDLSQEEPKDTNAQAN